MEEEAIAEDPRIFQVYNSVCNLVEALGTIPPMQLYEHVGVWQRDVAHQQGAALLALTNRKADITQEIFPGMTMTTRAKAEFPRDMSGMLLGPSGRCLVALVEHHDELGISATQMRRFLNQSAAALNVDLRDLVPQLMVFVSGRSPQDFGRA